MSRSIMPSQSLSSGQSWRMAWSLICVGRLHTKSTVSPRQWRNRAFALAHALTFALASDARLRRHAKHATVDGDVAIVSVL